MKTNTREKRIIFGYGKMTIVRCLLPLLLFLGAVDLIGQQLPVPIAQARLTPLGDTVTIEGVVLNGPELGVIRFLQDSTGGLAIYDFSMGFLQRGDLVRVTGVMDEYNQLLELVSISHHTLISSGNPLPPPLVITPAQLGEAHESVLVRINGVTFTNAGSTFSGNTNYNISAGGEQGVVRVVNNNPLVGQIIPTGMVDVVGIGSQFHHSNPNAGYRMMLRDSADILHQGTITFTSPLQVSNITTTSFDLSWSSDLAGSGGVYYGTDSDPTTLVVSPGNTTQHQVSVTGLSPADIVYVKAFLAMGGDTTFSGINVFATQSLSTGDIKVYFTSTVDHSYNTGLPAVYLNNLLDDTLIAYINRADQSIDLAIYNFNTHNISNIADALNDAHTRGVNVRVVYCGTTNNFAIPLLHRSIGRIPSPTTSEYAIMHNKFVVIDAHHPDPHRPVVWTGSMNLTHSSVNDYPNNVIIIQDQSLAKGYTLEFEQMFGSGGLQPDPVAARFGPFKTSSAPNDYIIGGRVVKSFFSPSDRVTAQLINQIESAHHEVFVNTMLITRTDIAMALRDQALASGDVRVLVNHPNDCTQQVVGLLTNYLGASFRKYDESGMLHHKTMITDPLSPGPATAVWTGSHNWSNAAEMRNDENVLIIFDTTIANLYLQEFMARWSAAEPLHVAQQKHPTLDVKVFPNPSYGSFTITSNTNITFPSTFELFSLDGRLVHQQQFCGRYDQNALKISTSLPGGIYIFRLSTLEGSAAGRLMVK